MPSPQSVSVIIAAYNAAGFIAAAIASVLAQTHAALQIIVIDDASSDNTVDVVAQLAATTPSLYLLRMEENRGPACARNAGIEAAKGDWIAILDADDIFEPARLEILLCQGAAADILADDLSYFDHAAQQFHGTSLLDRADKAPFVITTADFVRNNQGRSKDWGLLQPVFRRSFIEKHSLQYPVSRRHGEDFDLIMECLLAGGRFICVPQALYRYTMRHGGISGKESDLSRTLTDYAGMAKMARQWSTNPRLLSDPQTTDLLNSRARSLDRRAEFEAMILALSQRRIHRLLQLIIVRPGFAVVLVQHLFTYIRSKLARRTGVAA